MGNLKFIHLAFLLCTALGYNIEVNKVGKFWGEIGSQFGYSVAIVRQPNWTYNRGFEFYPKYVLIGAPNLTYQGIKGHGQVSFCSNLTTADLNCHWLNLTDVSNYCDSETACFEDSRLGHTLAVNRKYEDIYKQTSTVPMVSVCAPGWKNVFLETDPKRYQNYMIGMCLKLRDELQPLHCMPKTGRSYCWPFWTNTTTNPNSRPEFTYAQGGFSAAFTQDGLSEVTGGPGADDWRGAYIAHQKNLEKRLSDRQGKTIYFGYSLTTGRLAEQSTDYIVSGVPNYYLPGNHGHYGKFDAFEEDSKIWSVEFGIPQLFSDCGALPIVDTLDKDQMGSKFGATVAAVDLTGDDLDEILVGAPLYSNKHPEEGRVFVYTFRNKKACGPIGVLSGGAAHDSLEDKAAFARFGSAIASAGDLDNDGNKDVAIGAPYEDDGQGAVYIYPGTGNCDCIMPDVFSQRIAGADVDPGIRSFGFSIYGDEDVDDNTFPDLAVGAYQSDKVMLFRARPIVKVDVEMNIEPSPIPLNGSSLGCSRDKEQLCFNVSVLFQYISTGKRRGKINSIIITWSIESDTVYKEQTGKSRVEFRNFPGQSTFSQNITLLGDEAHTENYIVDVKTYKGKPEPQDAWTKVFMKGSYKILPSAEQDFQTLDPILHKTAKTRISESVEFDKKCDSVETCTSDLVLKVDMFFVTSDGKSNKVENDTVLYVDAFNELVITADVKNIMNSSYRALLNGEVTTVMRRDVSSNSGVISASCKYESKAAQSTNISCSADSKLDLYENIKVKSYFDISRLRLVPDMDVEKMKPNVSINFRAGQANKDVNMNNNVFQTHIDILLKYDISIKEETPTEYDQIRYRADNSARRLTLIHTYHVTNKGPSFLPMTFVNITLPNRLAGAELATIESIPPRCLIRGSQTGQTTTPEFRQSTTRDSIPLIDMERRRREVQQTTASWIGHENIGATTEASKIKNITCHNSDCVILECRIEKLVQGLQETIEIKLKIAEEEIAKMKGFQQIRYATTATVSDPSVWYGGKVVPFEHTVYAEKWTAFVVEPASVVSEINIWIIIGSVLGAVAVLVVLALILWKCGFFKRKKYSQVQEWKRASLYNRKSVRLSSASKPSYTQMEEKDKESLN